MWCLVVGGVWSRQLGENLTPLLFCSVDMAKVVDSQSEFKELDLSVALLV